MINLQKLQKDVFENKINQGFNTTDVPLQFAYTYGELGEAFEAYRKKRDDLGEEIADVVIYLLGLSEIVGINLEEEIFKKIEKNKNRQYKKVNGVLTRTKDA